MSQIAQMKQKSLNKSGIYPVGDRVLIKPDAIEEEVTDSGIILPSQVHDKYLAAQASGTVIALGADAFSHTTERVYHIHDNGQKEFIEERVKSYSDSFAQPGDRVAFAQYAGRPVTGEDGERYIVINDEDITAKISEGVEFTALDTRKGLGLK